MVDVEFKFKVFEVKGRFFMSYRFRRMIFRLRFFRVRGDGDEILLVI